MTNEERIAKAKDHIDFLWNMNEYWLYRSGEDSEQYKVWCARWVAAKDMYKLLTGEAYT